MSSSTALLTSLASDAKTNSRPLAATEKDAVRLVLLGLNFGNGIARHIKEAVPCLDLIGVCDQDQAKAEQISRDLNVKVYESLESVLNDPTVEAVGLFTGPYKRANLISKILAAKKHLITTKPFELDLVQARDVLNEAEKNGLVIHLNSPAPTDNEDLALIQDWVKTHQLGRPLCLHAQTWASYREKANGSWYDDPSLCPAAPILRLGIYFLNDFSPLMGKAQSVYAVQKRLFTQRPTSDHAQVSLEYDSGAIGTVFSSFCIGDGQPYRDQILLGYENGTIRRWMERVEFANMSRDYAVLELTTGGKTYRMSTAPGHYAGWYQWDLFARAVREKTPLREQAKQQILHGLELLEAIRRSLESGKAEVV